MPHKFNTSRRHKFAKKKYRVTNWCGYNESLRNRGDLTVWITGDARKHWAAPRRRSRGSQPRYSDLAITMCLTLGMVYRLPLRQTQGLIRSISKLMLLEISVPDFSTLSRRGRGLSLPARPKIKITDPVHLAIDSTGLKVFDEGEWLQSKYNVKAKRKRWRKLHLGLNLVTGDIVCSDLTLDDVGDPTVLPDLLNQIGTPVSRFIADGAYDGAPTSDLLKARFGEAVEIIIPPPKNAIPSPQSKCFPSLRDRHIVKIQTHGRMAWQSGSGYNQRSGIETQMGRWKAIIGPKLKARCFENQQTEAKIGVAILNKMTELGRPVFKQIS